MKNVFIINPNAGKGKKARAIIEKIKAYFAANGGEYEILETQAAGQATDLARQSAQTTVDAVRIYACGGDGTACEVLNGLVGYPYVEMGLIPCGTGNDFLKYFDSTDPFSDVEAQVKGTAFPVDIIKAGERYALNQCSIGMDATVADNVRLFKKLPVSSSMAYNMSVAYTFFQKMGAELDITIDGEYIGKSNCLFAVCANAPYYGGGYKSAPFAKPNDGKLDYCIVKNIPRLKILRLLGMYRKGTHTELDCCTVGTCSKMTVKAGKNVAVNWDGEVCHGVEMAFEVVKKGIKLVVPQGLAEKFKEYYPVTAEEPALV